MNTIVYPNKNAICAGIVSYNPDINKMMMNYHAIKPQVDVIIIVDNGSENIGELKEHLKLKKDTILIENSKNEGIAKALNQIFTRARECCYKWVLTLDQDSVCSSDIISTYIKHLSLEKVGILCPKVIYEEKDTERKSYLTHGFDAESNSVDACMTSGSLTSVEAWTVCGKFDEWMFIDLVDNDFCMRLKKHDYKILRINSATIRHQLGTQETIKLFYGIKIIIYNHSPTRNYYFVRNSIYLIKKHWKISNCFHNLGILIYWESKKLAFEKRKMENLKSLIKGIKDGCKKRVTS